MRSRQCRSYQWGFTVVEVAVVATIVAVLSAMAVPVVRYTVKRVTLEEPDDILFTDVIEPVEAHP